MKRFLTMSGIGLLVAGAILMPTIGQDRASSQKALLTQYCVSCHNDTAKTGGLSLEKLDIDRPETDAETWEKVVRKLRAGLMPPTGAPRPDRSTYETFRHNLQDALDRAAKANPNPGATP